MIARRLSLAMVVSLCTLGGGLVLSVPSALAELTHNYLSQFNAEVPAGSGVALSGPVHELGNMTLDSGHLWLVDRVPLATGELPRADEFDSSTGAFISQLSLPASLQYNRVGGIAVGHATGETEVYVAGFGPNLVHVFGPTGGLQEPPWIGGDTPNGSFGELGVSSLFGVAVDNSTSVADWAAGDVYVSTYGEGGHNEFAAVDVFKPEADGKEKYVTALTGISPSEPFSIPVVKAVSAFNGDVIVQDVQPGTGAVMDVFEPSGLGYSYVGHLTLPIDGSLWGESVAIDGSNGDIYATAAVEENGKFKAVVDEFNARLEYIGEITGTGTPTGIFGSNQKLRVAVESEAPHHVLVTINENETEEAPEQFVVDVFSPNLVIPDVTTEPVSTSKSTSVIFTGTVNPKEAGEATCQFVWGLGTEFGHTATCSEHVAEGASPVTVHSELTGLLPDTTYCYRLQASNASGTNPGQESQNRCTTTSGPGSHGTTAVEVSGEAVTLQTTINPHNAPTSYYFQYGRNSAYESDIPLLSESAPHGAGVGTGEGDVQVSQHIQGLPAHTLYHYRLIVISNGEEFVGPDQTFMTQRGGSSLSLLDGRAWELVTPPNKLGALIYGLNQGTLGSEGPVQASADGSAITYPSNLPTEAEPPGYPKGVQVLSRSSADGWSSTDITTPNSVPQGAEGGSSYQFFSEDLSLGLLNSAGAGGTLLSKQATEPTPYVRRQELCDAPTSASECYLPLVTSADATSGEKFGRKALFMGATDDLDHIALQSSVALTQAETKDHSELYEWSAGSPSAEQLQLISLLPSNEGGGPAEASALNIGNDPTKSWSSDSRAHALSSDGSRVFWTTDDGTHEALYMRDMVKRETIRLDVVQQGASGKGTSEPIFEIASSDGTKAFFTDTQKLTAQSGKKLADLYECEITEEAGKLKCKLTDLTPENAGVPSEVQNLVLGGSEDALYVYFVANGVLAPGATRGACVRESSLLATCNLYMLHAGVISFVATLSSEDEDDWGAEDYSGKLHGIGNLTARVSPNGHYVAFMSNRSLAGYDNHDAVSGKPDEEVYEYDAVTKRLICASCNPTGGRPNGVELLKVEGGIAANRGPVGSQWGFTWVAANLVTGSMLDGYGEALYQARYLSDSGRLFFDSSDALVPQDVNGTEDVYEFEPTGLGDCTTSSATFTEAAGGCADLVSSGTSGKESGLLDASEDGDDVFFLTAEKLVPEDYDSAFDVYDAHVCSSGRPCPNAAASTPECTTADGCRAAPLPQPPGLGLPSSATFSGTGNVVVPPPAPIVKAKPLTRAQKLARSLRACRKKKRNQRAVCERKVHAEFGSDRKPAKANAKKKGGAR